MAEIGSEFWTIESPKSDMRFFLSGRTALDFIIRDILAERKINAVHMPSFCCHTMVEPFVKNKIPVFFYDVYFENGILNATPPHACADDIFFYIKYFGYEKQNMPDLEKIKNNGCIIIEDMTHSWLMSDEKTTIHDLADYSFTSFRKWTGFTGLATAKKTAGKFLVQQKPLFYKKYEALRKEAQKEKLLYIETSKGNKQCFLEKFSAAEALLEVNYTDFQPSAESISAFLSLDKDQIKSKRRHNATTLLTEISGIKEITPFFDNLGPDDVPLCVPVLIDPHKRDALRHHLISQQIYCPVHWPLSPFHDGISEKGRGIYLSQLSFVCDQRYDDKDMLRFAKSIKSFFEV